MPTNRRQRTADDEEARTGAAHLDITRPDQLHALGSPPRWKILGRLLESPASVQELARALGVAKGTVGHHVRVLERAGLIRVVETKRVRGVTEKRYARVAKQFRLPPLDDVAPEAARDVGLMPLRQALAEARASSGAEDPSMSLVIRARMPVARARRFAALVELMAAEFADGAPNEGETFGLVAAIYVPDWADRARKEN